MKSFWMAAAVMLALGGSAALSGAATVPIAVKMGQKSVDSKSLPFAALAITQAGIGLPIQEIVFEDLETHTEITAMLAKSFSDSVDFISVRDSQSRLHSLFILRMKPGRYRIKRIENYIQLADETRTQTLDFTKIGEFTFKVVPDAVNYCGSLVIEANWVIYPLARPGDVFHDTVPAKITIEQTQKLDARWAAEVIPCLRNLPSVATPLKKK